MFTLNIDWGIENTLVGFSGSNKPPTKVGKTNKVRYEYA